MTDEDAGRPMPENSSDLPGSVSNQNREESTPGGAENAGHAPTEEDERPTPARERGGAQATDRSGEGRPGGAGESTQATGHPQNAG